MLRTLLRSTLLVALAAGALAVGAPAASASPETAPANDAFATPTQLTGASGSVTGTNVGATKEVGEPNHANHAGGASVWFTWTSPTTGMTRFDTCTSPGFFTLLEVYTGNSVDALTSVKEGANACAPGARVDLPVVAGQTYRIAIDGIENGSGATTGAYTLTWTGPPANDAFAAAPTLAGTATGSVSGTNVAASNEPGEPDHAGNLGGASVWYSWTAPTSATMRFDTCTATFDSIIAVYTGSSLAALTPVGGNDDACFVRSAVDLPVTAGTTYRIAVEGGEGGGETSQGTFTLRWAPRPARGADLWIRRGTDPWGGDDVYDATGRTQSRSASIGRVGTATFSFRMENDDSITRVFHVLGTPTSSSFRVLYRGSNGFDYTLPLTEGVEVALAPGQSMRFDIIVKPRASRAVSGDSISVKVRLTDLAALPMPPDTVLAKVTLR